MAIPKIIYQTFKSLQLPWLTRWHISRFRARNPSYTYEFYDDQRVDEFISTEYGREVFNLYKQINIGAAKADFFRYAILYKKGGVYLDIDSTIKKKLDDFILPTDEAIVSEESHPGVYVQWPLIYSAGHPFLERTIEIVLDNIRNNRFPNSVHQMTGPTAYTKAIKECLTNNPNIPHRFSGIDYDGIFNFSYRGSKLFLYRGNEHWKKQEHIIPVLKNLTSNK